MKLASFIFALGFGATITLVSWLLIYPTSPIHSSSSATLNLIGGLQILATFIAMILSNNAHGGGDTIYWILVICQWSVVGFVLSFIYQVARKLAGGNK